MERRSFVKLGLLSAPSFVALAQQPSSATHLVPSGTDRLGEHHSLGFSNIAFKVSGAETGGELFFMEHSNLTKGGPYRHVHPAQDEMLYALAVYFIVKLCYEIYTLHPGDSILMPRKVPHVWAQTSDQPGKLLIAFTPAGQMEDFFRDFGKTGKLPSDPTVLSKYGLERLGPPLPVA